MCNACLRAQTLAKAWGSRSWDQKAPAGSSNCQTVFWVHPAERHASLGCHLAARGPEGGCDRHEPYTSHPCGVQAPERRRQVRRRAR